MLHAPLLALAVAFGCPQPEVPMEPLGPRPQQEPLRIFLRAGPKTHGEGEHDHPRFLAEWSALLAERGCRVDGGQRFPTAGELARTDVLAFYAAEGATIRGAEREALTAFLARGGGIVVLHDAVCGDDPHWFKTVAGGAWEHGHSKWHEGEIGLYFTDVDHPITRGAAHFDMDDEVYWDLHLDPDATVLAHAFHTPFDVTPQMWTLERGGGRAFVSIQGHNHASFSHPAWRTLLLRGIAWAGGRDADALVTPAESAALRYPPGGPLPPGESAGALTPHPDFSVALVAAEPLVVNPISLDWDARGRMWVALTPGYPFKEESSGVPARDEVAILADADGDGVMDARTVFADGLDLVTSVLVHGDGALVAQAPEILYLRDTDGDDRADRREVLFSGFGFSDTHAVIGNFRRGLDGWVYATQGYSGNGSRHVVGRPAENGGTDHGHIGNGLFRFRPDGSAIETISSYGSNTWGLDFAPDGELFFTMANGSHLRHVVLPEAVLAQARFGRAQSWRQIVDHDRVFPLSHDERPAYRQIDFVGGFTAAAGCTLYDGGTWPAEFAGNHFVSEPTVNLVHRDLIAPDGVSYEATKPREAEFLASEHLWFRPVHARVGPDGDLYVLDFYNQAAIHNDTRGPEHGPTNAAVRPDRDRLHGRIWRVRHEAAEPLGVPELAGASAIDRVSALRHPNGWVRATAQRLLVADATFEGTSRALEALFFNPGPAKVHALWVAHEKGGASERLLTLGLGDPDPAVRKNAARIAGLQPIDAGMREGLTALLDDGDRRVRLEALVALGRGTPDAGALAALVALWPALDDDVERSGLIGALGDDPRALSAALLHAGDPAFGALVEELAGRAARHGAPAALAECLVGLAQPSGPPPAVLEPVLRRIARESAERDPASMPPAATSAMVQALGRLLARDDLGIAVATLPVASRWGGGRLGAQIERLAERLLETLGDVERPGRERLAALETLLALPERRAAAVAAAAPFLDPQEPIENQLAAIEWLGGADEPAVARLFVGAWPTLSFRARDAAFAHLVARPEWLAPLFEALERRDVSANDLGPSRAHRLRTHPDAEVARRAAALLTPETADKDALIARLLPVVEQPGDAAAGRVLFGANCGTCHRAYGEGAEVAPDLSGMGAHGARELLPFIVDPNRSVEAAYVEYVARTNDGLLVAGVLKRESADGILLAGSDGEHEVRRVDLAELRSTGRSPMPTGFEELGAEALRDIVAYLAGDYAGFRVLDMRLAMSASRARSMYDAEHENLPMRLTGSGVVDVEGVPFEVLDPERFERNVLVLRGGMRADWDSKTSMPLEVDVPVGFALERVHVLGGIAAWGHPFTKKEEPLVRWTWHYADGASEEVILRDGDQFADWIRPHDVPGSRSVPLVAAGSPGQVRAFSVAPSRGAAVERITLASYDTYAAPTFLALTAELPGAARAAPAEARSATGALPRVLIVGGGSSHDYERWVRGTDVGTLSAAELGPAAYTDRPVEIALHVTGDALEVLVLANNQPLPDAARRAVFAFVERGGGLVLAHAATWHNWADWPEYNAQLVGGGARSHEAYGGFDVAIAPAAHPVTAGVPAEFALDDELYRFEPAEGAELEVLATGVSRASGARYPVVFARRHGAGRIVAITLGHDGAAHEHPAYRALLTNAVRWAAND